MQNDSEDQQQDKLSVKRRKRQVVSSGCPVPGVSGQGLVGQGVMPIGEHCVGFQMLKTMGWKETKGLGKQEDGIRTPLMAFHKRGRKGYF